MKTSQLLKTSQKEINQNTCIQVLKHCLNLSDKDILQDKDLSKSEFKKYNEVVEKLISGIPLQYIIGSVDFYHYNFNVNRDVLIPRFETEGLVSYTIEYINQYFTNPKIIDLGCGSGIIGITLKKEVPTSIVTCIDISPSALCLTKKNAKKLNAKIKILAKDMTLQLKDTYDIIISNPPYISTNEKISDQVYNNEPHLALFAEENGLYFYNKILENAKSKLNYRSLIAFEIGMTQANMIIDLGKSYFPAAKYIVRQDLNNLDRYLFILNNLE